MNFGFSLVLFEKSVTIKNEELRYLKKFLWEYKSVFLAVAVAILLRSFVFQISIVHGESMYPTLQERDLIFCIKYDKSPKFGDIVCVHPPIEGEKRVFIKRVIGLPGDHIQIVDGGVRRNGKLLREPYINTTFRPDDLVTYSDVTLGEGQYFVMGDNRGNSTDSRDFGPVTKDEIQAIGRYNIFRGKSYHGL